MCLFCCFSLSAAARKAFTKSALEQGQLLGTAPGTRWQACGGMGGGAEATICFLCPIPGLPPHPMLTGAQHGKGLLPTCSTHTTFAKVPPLCPPSSRLALLKYLYFLPCFCLILCSLGPGVQRAPTPEAIMPARPCYHICLDHS